MTDEGEVPEPLLPEGWPRTSLLKVRVDGARGALAAQTIAYVARLVSDRRWRVSTCETRETWVLLHLPVGRTDDGQTIPMAADRAALDDLLDLLGAVKTASLMAKRAFVVLFEDEEVGRVAEGRLSTELTRDIIEPWHRTVGR